MVLKIHSRSFFDDDGFQKIIALLFIKAFRYGEIVFPGNGIVIFGERIRKPLSHIRKGRLGGSHCHKRREEGKMRISRPGIVVSYALSNMTIQQLASFFPKKVESFGFETAVEKGENL